MKRKKIVAFLEGARREGLLVRLKRRRDGFEWIGAIAGLSDEWLLLHEVERDWMRFTGYIALRVADFDRAKADTSFATRLLSLRGERPFPQPDILLVDLPGLLSSADAHFPLVTLHPEEKYPNSCWIGRVEKVGKRTVVLRRINPEARWIKKPGRFRLKDITRVDFGGGYEAALWEVAEHDRRLAGQGID